LRISGENNKILETTANHELKKNQSLGSC